MGREPRSFATIRGRGGQVTIKSEAKLFGKSFKGEKVFCSGV